MAINNNDNKTGTTFQKIVLAALIIEESGKVRCNLTDEQRAILNQRNTMQNAVVSATAKAFSKAISIQDAIESMMAPGASRTSSDIISDSIVYPTIKGKNRTVECAAAKTSNSCTANLVDSVIWKLYGGIEITEQKGRREMTVEIREDPLSNLFVKAPTEAVDTSSVTKRAAMGDVRLSGTVFPDDIQLADTLNKVKDATVSLKQDMIAALYSKYEGAGDDELICLYKNANRSLLEDIFEAQFIAGFGDISSTDAEKIEKYVELRRAYLQLLSAKFGNSVGNLTVDVGLRMRKQVIREKAEWSNTDKISRVHQFQNGSYYVSTHVDMGLGKIPSDAEIIAQFAERIDDVAYASMIAIEAEVRAELGIGYDISPIEKLNLKTTKLEGANKLFRTYLKIDRTKERELEVGLRSAANQAAEDVVKRMRQDESANIIRSITDYTGGK